MLQIVPDYYKEFSCIAGACRHSCCKGWEIDIDSDSAERYAQQQGEIGDRLRKCISLEDTAHFILDKDERCPFLNERGLCDIILTLGEDALCQICRDHPRFRNELPGRVETGLGLCCEEAARLILLREKPVRLLCTGEPEENEGEDEIIALRDELILLLQRREISIGRRAELMLERCCVEMPEKSAARQAEFLLGLERMDKDWTACLELLRDSGDSADMIGFDTYMEHRQTEYEQLLVYFIYRHFANAPDMDEAALRAAFAVFSYRIIKAVGAALWQRDGSFTKEQQTEIARLFSAETEYAQENMDAVLDWLAEEI